MAKKTNKQINNVQKYEDLEVMNEGSLEMCFEYVDQYAKDNGVSLDELKDVCTVTYDKDDQEGQIQEVIAYFGDDLNPRAKFWIKKAIKYNGLANWARWMQKKFISEGE